MRLSLIALACFACAHPAVPPDVLELHRKAIVVDTHSDSTDLIVYQNYDFGQRHDFAHEDVPRMGEGGLDAQFFSIFVYPQLVPAAQWNAEAMKQIGAMQAMIARNAPHITFARTAAEVRRNAERGVISALFGLEGGHMLLPGTEEEQLAHLRRFAELGVRYMTLTHGNTNSIGGSQGDEGEITGLTDFGRRVLEEMDRLGVMVDVSHVSDPLFWDVIRAVKKPVIASHSSSRELARHTRNMTDAMIKAVAKNGGAVCVNYWRAFLDDKFRDAAQPVTEKTGKMRTSERARVFESAGLPDVPLARIADHIEHIARVGGVDHVCLGSDFDGVPMLPNGLEDVSRLPRLTAELRRRGFSPEDLVKILGENTLRVMATNEPR
jgi:membrane dipeptidase